jgi:hypothetical protein
MAKQRGGSPFTDSWFEMPFWILFFLLIVTVILLWQFGIFNKPPVSPGPDPDPGPTPGPTPGPATLYAVDLLGSYFGPPVGIGPERFSYTVTANFARWNDPNAVLNLQLVTDGVAGTYFQIPWEDPRYPPPEMVQQFPKGTPIPKSVSVNAYLSVKGIAATPISSFNIPSSFPKREKFSLY